MTPELREALTELILEDIGSHLVYDGMLEVTARGGFIGLDNMTEKSLVQYWEDNIGSVMLYEASDEDLELELREEEITMLKRLKEEHPTLDSLAD